MSSMYLMFLLRLTSPVCQIIPSLDFSSWPTCLSLIGLVGHRCQFPNINPSFLQRPKCCYYPVQPFHFGLFVSEIIFYLQFVLHFQVKIFGVAFRPPRLPSFPWAVGHSKVPWQWWNSPLSALVQKIVTPPKEQQGSTSWKPYKTSKITSMTLGVSLGTKLLRDMKWLCELHHVRTSISDCYGLASPTIPWVTFNIALLISPWSTHCSAELSLREAFLLGWKQQRIGLSMWWRAK